MHLQQHAVPHALLLYCSSMSDCLLSEHNFIMPKLRYIVADVTLQILSSASLMATTNFSNHVCTNFYKRTARWVRLQLGREEYFAQLDSRQINSWISLLCRAALEDTSIQALLPSYTSLQQPSTEQMEWLQFLVATMQSLLGPLPVTDFSLRKQPWSYLAGCI